MNTAEHIIEFIQEMRRRKYSECTVKNYESNINVFFNWCQKDHPKNVNEQDIKTYLSRFDEPNTQRSHHGAIKLFYEICMNQPNKFKYIPYCKKSHKLPIVLSVEEIQRMFNACDNLKHKVILAILYSCSLRVSELLNLKWEHIDRSRMIINIIQAKGAKDRQVGLNDQLIELLTEYYKKYKPVTYVLNGQNGVLQYSSTSVNMVIKHLAEKAGIKNKRVYTHLIRHTAATHMLEYGTDINLIQKLLGHANVKTTLIYSHISHNLISKIPSPLKNINLGN